jgi:hypothetical protein
MSANHETFDKAAIFFLNTAYERFPLPVELAGPKPVREATQPDATPADTDFIIVYAFEFLARNGYIEKYKTGKSTWRFSLNDKGLLALKRPTLSNPQESVYDRIKQATAGGLWNISQGAAANIISGILLP